MLEHYATPVSSLHPSHFDLPQQPLVLTRRPRRMNEERLPFTVRVVRNEDDLNKAVQIRHAAYARHVPTFAETLRLPEEADANTGTVVLLAESKLDGSPLGTMRIQTNRFKQLSIEQSIQLPAWLRNQSLAEATRLGVTEEKAGRLVKTVLFKAFFLYCQKISIGSMVISCRAPVDRQYERLLFTDVYPGIGYVPMRHVGDMPHRIMMLEVDAVEPLWAENQQPLYDFFFRTRHPDIDIDGDSVSNLKTISAVEFHELAVMMG